MFFFHRIPDYDPERALFSVINTEFLDFSHNLLYSINLSKLRNLHFLNVTHNRFTNVPSFKDSVCNLRCVPAVPDSRENFELK